MQKPSEPVPNDLETLKLISDPLRMGILRAVRKVNNGGTPCSVKQIAEELGMPPARLYYHVRLLETHNVLQVSETRIVSGIIEKLYRVTENGIFINFDLLTAAAEPARPMISGLFKGIADDIQEILNSPPEKLAGVDSDSVMSLALRIPPRKIAEFKKMTEQFLDDVESAPAEDQDSEYNFFYIFYTPKKDNPK